jgi:hypothetical protein
MKTTKLLACAVCSALYATTAGAVSLSVDNTGQALIFPYYTVTQGTGSGFNTYLSVTNTTADTKAIRVRFREARGGREVASFNLYLAPRDVWAGALIPSLNFPQLPAALLSGDPSCASPTIPYAGTFSPGLDFSNTFYTGAFADGLGDGLDRTREGWVEMIEMGTLTGASATAVSHNSAGVPANCAAVQGNASLSIAPPTGGLSGTLTLIDVKSGMDFTVDADALANLSKLSFYRPAADPYPDFNAGEIEPVSVVTDNGFIYRSTWNRPVDAVSAVLMRSELFAEFILDAGTGSRTDFVVTLPTRNFYQTGAVLNPPFSGTAGWAAGACNPNSPSSFGTAMGISYATRDGASVRIPDPTADFSAQQPPVFWLCQGASVVEVTNERQGTVAFTGTRILGSTGRGDAGALRVQPGMQNGWVSLFSVTSAPPLLSLQSSTRTTIATGATTTGAHGYVGLPMTGLHLRTFQNGTLTCAGSLNSVPCQGNYGGSFPLKYRRSISPAN